MQLKKEKELLSPADTDQRDVVPLSGHPLKIKSDSTAVDFAAQSAVQQCNPLHNEPAALAPQRVSHPAKCFWCNCEKGYIYPSRKDAVRRSRKIWPMKRKSISTSSANAFNVKNADILPLSIRWIHNCILLLNGTISLTHLKVFCLFRAWSCLADSNVQKVTYEHLAINLLSMNRSAKLWFCSFNNAPVPLRGPLSPTSFLMSQRMFKWNKRPLCPAPFSCSMFGKWTAKEKLFHVVLSRTISHEHHELCIVS